MLSASDYRLFAYCSKPFSFPFCDTCIYFFLDADQLIYWCDDTSFAYLEVEMRTTFVIITFGVIKFTFPSGLIPFALMFCAEWVRDYRVSFAAVLLPPSNSVCSEKAGPILNA